MVNIINCSVNEFLNKTKNKEVVAFGAGRLFRSQFELARLKRVKYVIDSDKEKAGISMKLAGTVIPVVGKDKLKELNSDKNAIIITVTLAVDSILRELDKYENLQNVDCYLLSLMINKDEKQNIVFCSGKQKIPKIIHYCWFGKAEIPEHLKRYMESWSKYCPDYQIIRWDERNYDITKNRYMKEAYESRKWGFVPDYARIDIVYQYGGIYLDTDVEIIKSFDKLLNTSSFFGYVDKQAVNLGHGFGAERGNALLGAMKEYYKDKKFIQLDGSLDLRTCLEYQTPVLKEWGFRLDGKQEVIDNNVIYPREVFNPLGRLGINVLFTNNTHSIHHADISWESEENREIYKESLLNIKTRIQ